MEVTVNDPAMAERLDDVVVVYNKVFGLP
jgi:hypothetical protein